MAVQLRASEMKVTLFDHGPTMGNGRQLPIRTGSKTRLFRIYTIRQQRALRRPTGPQQKLKVCMSAT